MTFIWRTTSSGKVEWTLIICPYTLEGTQFCRFDAFYRAWEASLHCVGVDRAQGEDGDVVSGGATERRLHGEVGT